jgi:HSP20 family protein
MVEKKEKTSVREKKKMGEIAPWRPADYLQERDRMFRDFSRGGLQELFGSMLGPIRPSWMWPWSPLFEIPEVREPSTDLVDAGKEYRVHAEIPGVPKENLNITVAARSIEIEGEAKTDIEEDKEGFIRRERTYSKLHRSLAFPEEVVPDKAEATLKDGLLEVRIPKKTPTEVKKHKVAIK